jgi:hypothetical protein
MEHDQAPLSEGIKQLLAGEGESIRGFRVSFSRP